MGLSGRAELCGGAVTGGGGPLVLPPEHVRSEVAPPNLQGVPHALQLTTDLPDPLAQARLSVSELADFITLPACHQSISSLPRAGPRFRPTEVTDDPTGVATGFADPISDETRDAYMAEWELVS